MTKENFLKIMDKVDEAKDEREYLAGVQNAVTDGHTYEELGEVKIEVKTSLDSIDNTLVQACNLLRVPIQFLEDVLDSCVVNRWELYSSLILRRGRNG